MLSISLPKDPSWAHAIHFSPCLVKLGLKILWFCFCLLPSIGKLRSLLKESFVVLPKTPQALMISSYLYRLFRQIKNIGVWIFNTIVYHKLCLTLDRAQFLGSSPKTKSYRASTRSLRVSWVLGWIWYPTNLYFFTYKETAFKMKRDK